MKARTLALTLGVLAFVGQSRQARACSPGEPVQKYHTEANSTDTTPPVLAAAEMSIRRAEDPGDNSGGCQELGGYKITVEASDDRTPLAELGFALTLVDGSFPFPIPKGNVTGDDDPGELRDWFVDEGEAFDGTLEVRVVDRAGNLSEPKLVSASGDEVGCSCSAVGAPSRNYGGVVSLAGLMLLARGRRLRARPADAPGRPPSRARTPASRGRR